MAEEILNQCYYIQLVTHSLVPHPASQKQEGHSLNTFQALSALFSFPFSAILMRMERRS